jgi:hypothetical protein
MPAGPALRAGRGWDGLIVVCAVAAYDGIWMSDWHLARHLSELAPDHQQLLLPAAVRMLATTEDRTWNSGPARAGAAADQSATVRA